MDTKQVIVVRKDLKCHKGKICAQVGHAAIRWLQIFFDQKKDFGCFSIEQGDWFYGIQKKVVLCCENESELFELYNKATYNGLETYIIEDLGLTEFGKLTNTCLVIGPHESSKIDQITSHLKLY